MAEKPLKYPIIVGRVIPDSPNAERSQWPTKGTFAVITGKDANLFVQYDETLDTFVVSVQPTTEHAKTDGFIPDMKIAFAASNELYIEARQ